MVLISGKLVVGVWFGLMHACVWQQACKKYRGITGSFRLSNFFAFKMAIGTFLARKVLVLLGVFRSNRSL